MNKLLITLTIFSLTAGTSLAASYSDDYNTPPIGLPSGFYWDPTGGIGGSGALGFDTDSTANIGMLHNVGLAGSGPGHLVTVSAWFKMGLNGTALNDTTGNNVDGTNDAVFTMRLSTTPNWWDGTNAGQSFSRRANGAWGFKLIGDPWMDGWKSNTTLGWPSDDGSGTSGWFRMELELTAGGDGTYDQVTNIYGTDGTTLVYATPSFDTTIANGTTLYGGYWNGWYEGGHTLEEGSKINSLKIDNFYFEAVPEPGTLVLVVFGLLALLARRRR